MRASAHGLAIAGLVSAVGVGCFGIRRIIKIGETPHRFKPENAREESAVRDFERDGIRAVLYLTGRRVLAEDARMSESSPIKGPVDVTAAATDDPAPPVPAMDLRGESRRAMLSFDRESSYDFTAGGWTFIASGARVRAVVPALPRGRWPRAHDPVAAGCRTNAEGRRREDEGGEPGRLLSPARRRYSN